METPKVSFLAADTDVAQRSLKALTRRYGPVRPEDCDVLVSLGGDGWMLHTLHKSIELAKPVFGLNLGTYGFLCNDYGEDNLIERIVMADPVTLNPLYMEAVMQDGTEKTAHAFNEVSLYRGTHQSIKLRIVVDGVERLAELWGDGVLVATPAGSTAYNHSAHGPIIPIGTHVLALTPLSPFRPRHWRGALLPSTARVQVDVLQQEKRPVNAIADSREFRNVKSVKIREDRTVSATLLYDPNRNLPERVIEKQFEM